MKPTPNPGDKFHMLTFIKEGPRRLSGANRPVSLRTATVKCECGKVYDLLLSNLGKITGCGCNKRIYYKLNPEEVLKLYNEHKSTYIVADILKLKNANQVTRILKANGIQLIARKYFIDENYFETIDTEDKAYWLGFLAADGTIRLRHGGAEKKKRGSSIVLKLAIKDEHHLKKFAKVFGGDSRITYQRDYTTTRKGEESYSDNCRVSINSNKLVEDIMNKGVIPRKSFTLDKPNIDPIWYSHFIRGYFDGNGSVGFKTKEGKRSNRDLVIDRLHLSIATVAEDFKVWFIEHFRSLDIDFVTIGKYDMGCKNTKGTYRFLDYIYKDATVFLERKYEIAMEFMKYYEETRDSIDSKFYV